MVAAPPREMPAELAAGFTMAGRVQVEDWYLDGRPPAGRQTVFGAREIEANIAKIRRRKCGYYGRTDAWLYEALERFPVAGKSVVNMGSTNPWYESVALHFGAQTVTVIEYNRIVSEHPGIRAVTPDEFAQQPQQFEAAWSISSFEHDGLGRYGDPLEPDADLRAMDRMRAILQPGGLLYLAVPIGRDKVVWNAHRIYGPHRFPLLVQGWEILASFGGFSEEVLARDTGKDGSFQPVFVLENPGA